MKIYGRDNRLKGFLQKTLPLSNDYGFREWLYLDALLLWNVSSEV